jgi:hypothetical protein
VLLPEFGVPTTTMLASACLRRGMSSRNTRVSEALVTAVAACHSEVTGLLASQRDAAAKEPKFHWVAAKRGTGKFDISTLNETQHHQALNLWIRGINGLNRAGLAPFQ